jgi:hypothetical protein
MPPRRWTALPLRRVVVLAKACHERAGALLRNTAARRRNHMTETQDEW